MYIMSPYIPEHLLIAFTRVCLSSHRLRIETGRWARIPRERRLCDCGAVQAEEHVLVRCPLTETPRCRYGKAVTFPDIIDSANCVDDFGFIHDVMSDWLTDWDKFIQHNMTLYRCMISDIHDSSYVLFSNNLISNTSLHVGRPLLRPCLVAYAEATLARQKDSATNEKCWHHFRILIVDMWSVVWNECKNPATIEWMLCIRLCVLDQRVNRILLLLRSQEMAAKKIPPQITMSTNLAIGVALYLFERMHTVCRRD